MAILLTTCLHSGDAIISELFKYLAFHNGNTFIKLSLL